MYLLSKQTAVCFLPYEEETSPANICIKPNQKFVIKTGGG